MSLPPEAAPRAASASARTSCSAPHTARRPARRLALPALLALAWALAAAPAAGQSPSDRDAPTTPSAPAAPDDESPSPEPDVPGFEGRRTDDLLMPQHTPAPAPSAAPSASSTARPYGDVRTPPAPHAGDADGATDGDASSLAEHMRKRRAERRAAAPAQTAYTFAVEGGDVSDWDDKQLAIQRWQSTAVAGSQIFLWPYLVSLLVGSVVMECKSSCDQDTKQLGWLALPVAGPFIAAAAIDGETDDAGRAILLIDGGLQTAGLAITLIALGAANNIRRTLPKDPTAFTITPFASPTGAGLGMRGTF